MNKPNVHKEVLPTDFKGKQLGKQFYPYLFLLLFFVYRVIRRVQACTTTHTVKNPVNLNYKNIYLFFIIASHK